MLGREHILRIEKEGLIGQNSARTGEYIKDRVGRMDRIE